MPWMSALPALISGGGDWLGSRDQSKTDRGAAAGAIAAGNTAINRLNPYADEGKTAIGDISNMNDYLTHQFNAQDLNSSLAPNYQWQLQQGQQAASNAANMQGGSAGNYGVALQNYTQGLAGNAYQQAFNNYQTQRQDVFSNLYSIAGLGANAATQQGNWGVGAQSQANQYNTAGAAARAAGDVGMATQGAGFANLYDAVTPGTLQNTFLTSPNLRGGSSLYGVDSGTLSGATPGVDAGTFSGGQSSLGDIYGGATSYPGQRTGLNE